MIATCRLEFRHVFLVLSLLLVFDYARGQNQTEQLQSPQTAGGRIHGIVKSGNMPIPGAAVSISLASSDQKTSDWTDVDGSYSASVPSYGSYTVRVEMVAFSNSTLQVVVDASHLSVSANFELTLLSRTRQSNPQARRPDGQAWRSAWLSNSFCIAEHGCTGGRRQYDERCRTFGDAGSRN